MAVNQNQNTLITNTPYLIVATACTFTLRVKCHYLGFPGGSDGKESACNVGDHGSIPESGRSPGDGMATHSSILGWRIPWTEEPGGL